MGKARSFRLTEGNELRLKELMEYWKLDNENKTLNYLIEESREILKLKPSVDAFTKFIDSINSPHKAL